MIWLLITASAWLVLAGGLAVLVGRSIRMADKAETPAAWTADVERYLREHSSARLP